jgi:hypothetical protein
MSCPNLDHLPLENLISKANYPVFRCEQIIRWLAPPNWVKNGFGVLQMNRGKTISL